MQDKLSINVLIVGGWVKKDQNFADVIYGRSLTLIPIKGIIKVAPVPIVKAYR